MRGNQAPVRTVGLHDTCLLPAHHFIPPTGRIERITRTVDLLPTPPHPLFRCCNVKAVLSPSLAVLKRFIPRCGLGINGVRGLFQNCGANKKNHPQKENETDSPAVKAPDGGGGGKAKAVWMDSLIHYSSHSGYQQPPSTLPVPSPSSCNASLPNRDAYLFKKTSLMSSFRPGQAYSLVERGEPSWRAAAIKPCIDLLIIRCYPHHSRLYSLISFSLEMAPPGQRKSPKLVNLAGKKKKRSSRIGLTVFAARLKYLLRQSMRLLVLQGYQAVCGS